MDNLNYIHLDIKPENILLKKQGFLDSQEYLIISDLDLAKKVQELLDTPTQRMQSILIFYKELKSQIEHDWAYEYRQNKLLRTGQRFAEKNIISIFKSTTDCKNNLIQNLNHNIIDKLFQK